MFNGQSFSPVTAPLRKSLSLVTVSVFFVPTRHLVPILAFLCSVTHGRQCVFWSFWKSPRLRVSLQLSDFDSRMDCISFASSFCHIERLRTFHVSSLERWSEECHNSLSRNGIFPQLPVVSGAVPSLLDSSAKELESSLQFLSHHTATAMATLARKQKPHRLEQTRISLLTGSFCCAGGPLE